MDIVEERLDKDCGETAHHTPCYCGFCVGSFRRVGARYGVPLVSERCRCYWLKWCTASTSLDLW